MSEELEQRLIASMDHIAEWVQSAESFSIEHAPDIAREIVIRGMWTESAEVVACLIPFTLSVGILIYLIVRGVRVASLSRTDKNLETINASEVFAASWYAAIFSVVFLVAATVNIVDVIKIVVAPKLYVLEVIRDLL